MIGGRILDTSALVAVARGRPYMQALLYVSHEHLIMLIVPAPCLADALASLDDPEDRERLFDLLRSPIARVAPFGETEARGTGLLRSREGGRGGGRGAGHSPASAASTAVAHAAFLAADRGWPVVSAAPGPIRALHPEVEIEPLP